jgi:hypothetical protein
VAYEWSDIYCGAAPASKRLIKPALSPGGVEAINCAPAATSHEQFRTLNMLFLRAEQLP